MKRILFSMTFVLTVSVSLAQTGNNAVGIGADVYLPIRYFGEAYGVGVRRSCKRLVWRGHFGTSYANHWVCNF